MMLIFLKMLSFQRLIILSVLVVSFRECSSMRASEARTSEPIPPREREGSELLEADGGIERILKVLNDETYDEYYKSDPKFDFDKLQRLRKTSNRLRKTSEEFQRSCVSVFEESSGAGAMEEYKNPAFEVIDDACKNKINEFQVMVTVEDHGKKLLSILNDGDALDFIAFHDTVMASKEEWAEEVINSPDSNSEYAKFRYVLDNYVANLPEKIKSILKILNDETLDAYRDSGANFDFGKLQRLRSNSKQLQETSRKFQKSCALVFEDKSHIFSLRMMNTYSDSPYKGILGKCAFDAIYENCDFTIKALIEMVTEKSYKKQLESILDEGDALGFVKLTLDMNYSGEKWAEEANKLPNLNAELHVDDVKVRIILHKFAENNAEKSRKTKHGKSRPRGQVSGSRSEN